MIQDYEQQNRQKSNDSRQNNRNVDVNIRSRSSPYPT